MSSRDGLLRADIDTGLYSDPKVKSLARLQGDPVKTAATMTLYVSTVLDSWAEDRRVSVRDARPAWWLDEPTEMIGDLMTVGLLDRKGLIPSAVLERWLAPTRARIAAAQRAADARWSDRSANGHAPAMRSHSDGNANSQPASQKSQPVARERARRGVEPRRETSDPRSLREILRETTGEPNIVKGETT